MGFGDERPGRVRMVLAGLAALVCSAVLFYFGTGLAIVPIAALTWLAPLPVLLVAPRVSARAALGVAFLAYFLGTANSWGFFLHSGDVPLPVGMLISVALSLMFVLAVWIFRGLLRRGRPLLAAVAAPAAWTGAAYLVQVSNPMGLMGTFANSQGDQPLVLQIASVTGGWGVEFLVLFAPAAVAALCAPGVATAARWRSGVAAAAMLAIALGYGAVRLVDNGGGADPTQRVAMVAQNHATWGVDVATPAGRDLVASYVDQVAAVPGGTTTVVLPESAFSADNTSLSALAQPMSQVARARGINIVVGVTQRAQGKKFATALTFPAGGGDPVSYLKHHDRVSPPGHDLVVPPVTGARMGIEICADLDFANPSRGYAQAGAQLMAIPASDNNDNGWVHSRVALLRGVENGFAVAWSGAHGTLLVADGHGRVLAEARTDGPIPFTTAVADVPTGPGATPYTHLGDWFAWLCLALTLSALIASHPRKSRRQPDLTTPNYQLPTTNYQHRNTQLVPDQPLTASR